MSCLIPLLFLLSSFRILGSIVILGKACDLIDQHQQSMAASPAKGRPPPPPTTTTEEAAGEAAEDEGEDEASPEEQESGIQESGKAENREAAFPIGSKVEDIVPSAAAAVAVASDFSRDAFRFCRET